MKPLGTLDIAVPLTPPSPQGEGKLLHRFGEDSNCIAVESRAHKCVQEWNLRSKQLNRSG